MTRSITHLHASISHLPRSEAHLTPHVRSVLALLHPNEPPKALLGPSWGRLGAQNGRLQAVLGPSWDPKIELKRRSDVKNRDLTLLNRSITHLNAVFNHLQRSEADLRPHLRSVLALLHPNEPRKALLRPSWGRLGAQDGRKMGPRWPKRRLQNRARTWEGYQKSRLDALDAICNAS